MNEWSQEQYDAEFAQIIAEALTCGEQAAIENAAYDGFFAEQAANIDAELWFHGLA